MDKKQIPFFFDLFARIATLIFLFSSIYIIIFFGVETELNVLFSLVILAIALICTVLHFALFGNKEMSKKRMLITKIIYFISVNLIVLTAGYFFHWFNINDHKMLLGLEITIILVYTSVLVISHLFDLHTAEKMNEKLKNRQKK